jgi:ABC-type sugar transport system permease subunit
MNKIKKLTLPMIISFIFIVLSASTIIGLVTYNIVYYFAR